MEYLTDIKLIKRLHFGEMLVEVQHLQPYLHLICSAKPQ